MRGGSGTISSSARASLRVISVWKASCIKISANHVFPSVEQLVCAYMYKPKSLQRAYTCKFLLTVIHVHVMGSEIDYI